MTAAGLQLRAGAADHGALVSRTLPPGTSSEWTAMSYQEKLAGRSAYFIFGLAMLLVYLVLAGQYGSWVTPAAVILAVPLALLGTAGALLALGVANNIYVQIGLVLLIALSAKNAILIVEMARELRAAGKSILEAAVEAARKRFRPIIMTSFAFILGVLPLVLANGAGAAARDSSASPWSAACWLQPASPCCSCRRSLSSCSAGRSALASPWPLPRLRPAASPAPLHSLACSLRPGAIRAALEIQIRMAPALLGRRRRVRRRRLDRHAPRLHALGESAHRVHHGDLAAGHGCVGVLRPDYRAAWMQRGASHSTQASAMDLQPRDLRSATLASSFAVLLLSRVRAAAATLSFHPCTLHALPALLHNPTWTLPGTVARATACQRLPYRLHHSRANPGPPPARGWPDARCCCCSWPGRARRPRPSPSARRPM